MRARGLTLLALAIGAAAWFAAGWLLAAIGVETGALLLQGVLALAALGPAGRLLDRHGGP